MSSTIKQTLAIVTYICDVKTCTRPAMNEFETKSGKLYLCDAHCFVSFRSAEYHQWISSKYEDGPIRFSNHVLIQESRKQEMPENFGPRLTIVKSDLNHFM